MHVAASGITHGRVALLAKDARAELAAEVGPLTIPPPQDATGEGERACSSSRRPR